MTHQLKVGDKVKISDMFFAKVKAVEREMKT